MRPALPLLLLLALAARGDDAPRVEDELVFVAPADQEEALWAWLQRRYGAGEGSILAELGAPFGASLSDEAFVDRYFDTPGLAVLRQDGGVRHRTRRNLVDASDRKHGRQLVQVKLRREGEATSRTELKFDVDAPRVAKDAEDRHPLLGLVRREQRPALVQALAAVGVEAAALQETLTIAQRRRRVYVSRAGRPLATLTLDHASSTFGPWRVELVGLDVELSEVAYTAASPRQRDEMRAVSRRLADDVRAAFPALRQDQTPKYRQVFRAFDARAPRFAFLLVHGGTLATAAVIGVPLLLLGAWELRRRWRRRPPSAAA